MKPDSLSVVFGAMAVAALVILAPSVLMSILGLWRATSHRTGAATRWSVLRHSRWVGSNEKAMALLTAEGQRLFRGAIRWQRVSVVGLGLFLLTVVGIALVGLCAH
jgi:hypothetical protein